VEQKLHGAYNINSPAAMSMKTIKGGNIIILAGVVALSGATGVNAPTPSLCEANMAKTEDFANRAIPRSRFTDYVKYNSLNAGIDRSTQASAIMAGGSSSSGHDLRSTRSFDESWNPGDLRILDGGSGNNKGNWFHTLSVSQAPYARTGMLFLIIAVLVAWQLRRKQQFLKLATFAD